jgi:hypothetical protein
MEVSNPKIRQAWGEGCCADSIKRIGSPFQRAEITCGYSLRVGFND